MNAGDPAAVDALNTWESCTSLDGGTTYFMPAYLANITNVTRVAADGDGNPLVTYDRAVALGLQFRARYTP